MTLNEVVKKIKIQDEKISKLEKKLANKNFLLNKIEKEVAKAIYHQSLSMEHRIDQFLFDAKIAMKDNDKKFIKKLKKIKKNLNICDL